MSLCSLAGEAGDQPSQRRSTRTSAKGKRRNSTVDITGMAGPPSGDRQGDLHAGGVVARLILKQAISVL